MIGLAGRSLATRWIGFVGSVAAIALGVAVAAVAALSLATAYGAPAEPPRWYQSPDVVVAGPAGLGGGATLPPGERGYLPPGTAARLAAVDGVGRVVVDRAPYARLDAATEAHPWSAAAVHPYAFTAGGPPASDTAVVVTAPSPFRRGEIVRVDTVDGPLELTVSGVLTTSATPALYVTDATAERLARGRVAAVALWASTDPDGLAARVRAALADQPRLRVLTGDGRRAAEPDPDAGLLIAATALLGETAALAAVVSAFTVAGTFAFTAAQRRREFALLRTAGATPRQIRRLVLGEALGAGIAGGLAGCVLGAVLAPPFARWLARSGLAPGDFTARFTLWPLAAAFALGLGAAVAGAWVAARRAGRTSPVEALRAASVERRAMSPARWGAGAVCVAGIVPLAPLLRVPEGAAYLLLVVLLLVSGAALLAPAVAPPIVRRLCAGTRGPARELTRHSAGGRRTGSTATPVLMTVALAGATLAGTATLSATQAGTVRDHVTAPLVVTPSGPTALSDAITAAARGTPGVTAAVPVKQTFAYDRAGRQQPAWYLDGPAATGALRLPTVTGTLADLNGEAVAVTRSVADAHGWTVGSTAELWLGDGAPVRLRVVATLHDRIGLPTVLLPWRLASAHSALPAPDAVYIGLAPGAQSTALRKKVGALGGTVVPTSAYLSTVDAEFDRLARLALLAIVGMAVLYTAISIANTQLMAVAARADELATLRLAGATPSQIRRIVVCEATLATTAGGLLAAAVTAATLAVLAVGLAPVASDVHIVVPWPTLAATAAACVAIAALASLAPTYRRSWAAG